MRDKRQLVFYGPPGTGKTYIARGLARHIAAGESERFTVVQFHPSYSYEDFVQGYRPRQDAAGNMTYELRSGPLLRIAEHASRSPDRTFVLLVDEINRGNLPRIFGELLFLLEYRDEAVSLMYGDGDRPFRLPPNLWVIATMNTADRSIGLIDAALRRRFHFLALFPGRPPLQRTLRDWLERNAPDMGYAADLVDELNRRLAERFGEHLQVGHSYFMQRELDEETLARVWEVDILPFLEDQLFGREDLLDEFRLEWIRRPAPATPRPDLSAEDEEVGDALAAPDRV